MKKNNKAVEWKSTDQNPDLKKLKILIGDWKISGSHPLIPNPINGKVSFNWLYEESFLVMSTDFEQSGPPDNTAVIGSDGTAERLSMLYFDEREVSRIYEVKFNDDVLEIWRNFPGFSQRYKGTIKDNENTIEGVWELCEDDINWKKDLEITYSKIK